MKPDFVILDDLQKEQENKARGKLFLGARCFAMTKKHYGILRGACFQAHGVKFILDTRLGDNEVYSSDPYLVDILKKMEALRDL